MLDWLNRLLALEPQTVSPQCVQYGVFPFGPNLLFPKSLRALRSAPGSSFLSDLRKLSVWIRSRHGPRSSWKTQALGSSPGNTHLRRRSASGDPWARAKAPSPPSSDGFVSSNLRQTKRLTAHHSYGELTLPPGPLEELVAQVETRNRQELPLCHCSWTLHLVNSSRSKRSNITLGCCAVGKRLCA